MKINNKQGYVALLTVIVLGAVATLVSMSLVLLGLGHSRTSLSENQSASAKSAADACANEALRQIRLQGVNANTYTVTNVPLTLTGSSCTYSIATGAAGSITTVGVSGSTTNRVTVEMSARLPNITFTKWNEN